MTNEEILKKALNKALENGFPDYEVPDVEAFNMAFFQLQDFAKAFFGDEIVGHGYDFTGLSEKKDIQLKAWELHLKNMIISKDPIAYLESYL